MIAQLLDKDFVLRHMEALTSGLDQEIALQQQGDTGAQQRKAQTGIDVADLQHAKQELLSAQAQEMAQPQPSEPAYYPRQPVMSAGQSVLQEYLMEHRKDLLPRGYEFKAGNALVSDVALTAPDGVPLDNLFSQFGPIDIGFVTVLFAVAVRALRGRHDFKQEPAPLCRISDSARLILLSDWGTGVPRARKVAAAARRCLDEAASAGREVHVLHLGDVYYSGWASEYDAHFLPYWPVKEAEADRFGSWCLNGNHDMYSGGQGYFDHLLGKPQFQRQAKSSFFRLENAAWQFLALDTAYKDFDLQDPQPDWVAQCRHEAASKKCVLFSHHQPFSKYEEAQPHILERLRPVLKQRGVLAWFWGHEHRCAFYEPQTDPNINVRFGRCVGHSGVPVFAPNTVAPDGVAYEFGDWVLDTLPHFARFGFVVLDCDKDTIHAQYLDEDGTPHNAEDIA